MDARPDELAVISTLPEPPRGWLRDRTHDTVIVSCTAVLLIFLSATPAARETVSAVQLTTALTLLSAAVGSIAAMGAGFFGSLSDSPRGLWLCLALTVYSLLGIPAATLSASVTWEQAAVADIRLLAHILFVVLIYLSALSVTLPTGRGASLILGLSVTLITGGVLLGANHPTLSLTVTTDPSVRFTLAVVWLITPVPMVIISQARRSKTTYRIGLACAVLCLAHYLRMTGRSPFAPPDLTFVTLRLFSLILMMIATASLAARSLRHTRHRSERQRADLRIASMSLRKLAERDHELRTGLAGLAGAAELITAHPDRAAELRSAVASEVKRLNTLW
jgi:two-component system OmpR family sensor kinase